MDTYEGRATITDGSEHLRSVHVYVEWQEDRWWGVLTSDLDTVEWVGQSLVLRIDDHPEASLALPSMGTQSETGRWTSHFVGTAAPPFWSARPRDELVAELCRRRPVATSLTPGVEPPSYRIPDKVADELRKILTDRDGLTDEEIDGARQS